MHSPSYDVIKVQLDEESDAHALDDAELCISTQFCACFLQYCAACDYHEDCIDPVGAHEVLCRAEPESDDEMNSNEQGKEGASGV